jgi:hypothetical protein
MAQWVENMSYPTVEERVAALEEEVARLSAQDRRGPSHEDWRSTFGMFAGDSVMKEIIEEGSAIRQLDREEHE